VGLALDAEGRCIAACAWSTETAAHMVTPTVGADAPWPGALRTQEANGLPQMRGGGMAPMAGVELGAAGTSPSAAPNVVTSGFDLRGPSGSQARTTHPVVEL